MSEIIVLAIIGLIVIGPKELPELARTIGRFLNDLKRSTDGLTEDFKNQIRLEKFDNYTNHIPHPEDSQANSEFNHDQSEEQLSLEGHGAYHPPFVAPVNNEPEQLELVEQPAITADSNSDDKEKKQS